MPPLVNASTNPASNGGATSVLEVDYDRNVTRLYQSIVNEDWHDALEAVLSTPRQARTWVVRYEKGKIKWRFLPIHSASARDPPLELMEALLEAFPAGSSCEDNQGMWPLHYACGNQAGFDLIRLLLESFPDAAKMPDVNGMLPLHYLTKWGPSEVGILDLVLSAHPEAISAVAEDMFETKDGQQMIRRMTPLDLAIDAEGVEGYDNRDEVVAALERRVGSSSASNDKEETQPVKRSPSQDNSAAGTEGTEDTAVDQYQPEPPAPAPAPARAPSPVPQAPPTPSRSLRAVNRRAKSPATTRQAVTMSSASSSHSHRVKSPAADLGNKTTIAKLVAQLESTRRELNLAKKEALDLREEKKSHEAYATHVEEMMSRKDEEMAKALKAKEEEMAEKDEKLTMAIADAERMSEELAEMTARHDKLMEKADDLNGHVIALSSSVASLVEDRATINDVLVEREERAKRAAQLRQKKLHELIDYEVELARVTEEEEKEGSLQEALERQREEMEAVAAILHAVNAKEALGDLESMDSSVE